MKSTIAELEAKENQIIADRDAALVPIGNLVHDSVPVSDNEVSWHDINLTVQLLDLKVSSSDHPNSGTMPS